MKMRKFTPSAAPRGEVVDDDWREWRSLRTVKSSHCGGLLLLFLQPTVEARQALGSVLGPPAGAEDP